MLQNFFEIVTLEKKVKSQEKYNLVRGVLKHMHCDKPINGAHVVSYGIAKFSDSI